MKKILFLSVLFAFLIGACEPIVITPTPPAGSELVVSFSDGRTIEGLIWSPSGQELAFATFDPPAGKGLIYIVDLRTHILRTLGNPNYIRVESWSPDGKYIAYSVLDEIYIIPVEGSGEPQRLSSGQVASFSPDGKQVAIVENTGPANRITSSLKILELDTHQETTIFSSVFEKFSLTYLSWSPNGTKLALALPTEEQVKGKYQQDIYLFDMEKQELSRFTFGGHNAYPRWSPTGKQIAYLSSTNFSFSIIISQVDGGCKIELSGISNPRNLAWSPDSRYLAYSLGIDTYEGIYTVDLAAIFGSDFADTGPQCP